MTAKRFKVVNLRDYNICDIQDTSQEIPTFYNDLTYNFGSAKAICNLLNELHEENEMLKQFKEQVFKLIDEKNKEYETQKPLVRSLWKREALKELKKELSE